MWLNAVSIFPGQARGSESRSSRKWSPWKACQNLPQSARPLVCKVARSMASRTKAMAMSPESPLLTTCHERCSGQDTEVPEIAQPVPPVRQRERFESLKLEEARAWSVDCDSKDCLPDFCQAGGLRERHQGHAARACSAFVGMFGL